MANKRKVKTLKIFIQSKEKAAHFKGAASLYIVSVDPSKNEKSFYRKELLIHLDVENADKPGDFKDFKNARSDIDKNQGSLIRKKLLHL